MMGETSMSRTRVARRTFAAVASLLVFTTLTGIGATAAPATKTISFSSATYTAYETDGTVLINVHRSWSSGKASVKLSTVAGGNATPDTDYTAVSNLLLNFKVKQTDVSAVGAIADDGGRESPETVNLGLSGGPKGVTLGAQATVTIHDDHGSFPDNLEVASDGWRPSGDLWHVVNSSTCGPPGYSSATHALYYGDDTSCDYD